MSEIDPKKLPFFDDAPADDRTFASEFLPEAIAGIIRDDEVRRSSFTIALMGGFGLGKSSVMQCVSEALAVSKDPFVVPIWFSAQRYQHEDHALLPFFLTFHREFDAWCARHADIDEKLRLAFRKIGKTLAGFAMAAAAAVDVKFKVPGLEIGLSGKSAMERAEAYAKRGLTRRENAVLTHTSMLHDVHAIIRDTILDEETRRKIRFAFFVDDIDRMLPEDALRLMEQLKTILDVPGVYFVLALDEPVVEAGLAIRYKKSPQHVVKSKDYLEKLIQLRIHLREWDVVKTSMLTSWLLRACLRLRPYADLIAYVANRSPRQTKALINQISLRLRIRDLHLPVRTAPRDEAIIKWTLFEHVADLETIRQTERRPEFLLAMQSAANNHNTSNPEEKRVAVEKMLSPAPGIRGYTPLTIIAAPLFEILTLHDREVDAGRKERDTGFITREEVENLFAFLAFSATRTEPSPPVGVAQADEAALPADLDPVAQRILELREWIQLETIQYESLRAKPETDEVLRELGTSAAQLAVAWSSLSELESDPTRVQSAEGFVEASISAFNRLDKDSMGVVATSFENLGDSQDGLGYPVSALVYHVIASSLFGHLGRDSDRQRVDEKIVKIRPKKSDE